MHARQQLLASGLGYLDFAISSPALFRLMFSTDKPEPKTPELAAAAEASFMHLVDGVARLRGISPFETPAAMNDVMAIWSMVHGFADLYIAGRLGPLDCKPPEDRDALLKEILGRAMV